MVTIKFIVEVVLVVIGLAIMIWWLSSNFSNLTNAFINWIESLVD